MKNRMVSQDIAKGLAVLVVLWAHTSMRLENFSAYFFLPFAYVMAFFFIISGFNYKKGKRSKGQNILLRFKQLIIPLAVFCIIDFLFMLAISLPNGFSFKLNVLGLLNNFFMTPTLQACRIDALFGVESIMNEIPNYIFSWFIWYMFFGYCLFYLIVDFIMEKSYRFFISIPVLIGLTVLLVWLCNGIHIPFNIHYTPLVTSFLLTGAYLNKKEVFTNKVPLVWTIVISVVLCVACCSVYLFGNPQGVGKFAGGSAYKSKNAIGLWEIPITYLVGVACTYYFINFCRLLAKVKFIVKPFTLLGENSFGIYIFQFGVLNALYYVFGLNCCMKGEKSELWEVIVGYFAALIICLVASILASKLIKLILVRKPKKEEIKND